jgi:integrase/recombinase XerD
MKESGGREMKIHMVVEQFQQYQMAQDHSVNTIRSYHNDLHHFIGFLVEKYNYMLDLEEVTTEDIEAYLYHLNVDKGYTPSSRKRKLAVIRSLFRYCEKKKLCSVNPSVHVESVRLDHRERVFLTEQEVERVAAQIEHTLIRLVIVTLYYTGMRISECLSLKLSDVDFNKNVIKVKMSKGRKDRPLPMNERLKEKLQHYVEHERPYSKHDLFFCTPNSGKLNRNYVNKILSMALDELGMSQEITAHTFRHSFASNLLQKGAHIVHIQKLLGHTSLSTTSVYTHVNMDELAKVVAKL